MGAVKLLAALQLYHLENGRYPQTLDQLVPVPLKSLPRDWASLDGKFLYKLQGAEFTLESGYRATEKDPATWRQANLEFYPLPPFSWSMGAPKQLPGERRP